ncbi:MAG: hypothetical protein ABH829_04010 [archaeon]
MELSIVPVGTVPNALLNHLKYALPEHIGFEKVTRERDLPLPSTYDGPRKQYCARGFFSLPIESRAGISLLVTDVDIFIEPLEYVFGHYQGRTALVSVRRLSPAFTGADNPESLRTRSLNHSLHEIGHALGLGHCKKGCVMRLSPSVVSLDSRPIGYCPSCKKQINKSLKKK